MPAVGYPVQKGQCGGKGSGVFTELPFSFPGRIFRSAMPFGPFDHLNQIWSKYQEYEVDVVAVLVEPAEYLTHAQRDLPAFYRGEGLEVIHLPIPDHHRPRDMHAFQRALDDVSDLAHKGKNVAVHCLAGIGRTGTFLACLAQRMMGLDGREALQWVRESIPGAVENEGQERFVINFSQEVKP